MDQYKANSRLLEQLWMEVLPLRMQPSTLELMSTRGT